MANVVLENVCKSYDKTSVIRDVSLSVRDREFVVLVGPSGCGKSTLLRMIAGLESVTSGSIHIADTRVNDVPPKDRDIAMVFQNYALYPHMTVYDNMSFGLRMRRMPKPDIQTKVLEAARILDLEALLQRKPRQLSGGQRQRVALGRAIVRNPKVFLMDEPLSNLDAKLRVQMRAEISDLHRRLNATTLYVTHDQVEAMTMGERIVILNRGCIQQVDTPLRVYQDPANLFVAGFVGQINTLRGMADSSGFVLEDGTRLPLSGLERTADGAMLHTNGRPVILGLRPEHVLPAPEGLDDSVEVTPYRVELLGGEQAIHFRFGAERLLARWPSEIPVSEGQPLKVRLELSKAFLFDAATEHRLSSLQN